MAEALIALEDGSLYPGVGFGAEGATVGEVVFTTSMTGYQETLTDPSYHRQIIVATAPHVGNVGVNADDPEFGENMGGRFCRPRLEFSGE